MSIASYARNAHFISSNIGKLFVASTSTSSSSTYSLPDTQVNSNNAHFFTSKRSHSSAIPESFKFADLQITQSAISRPKPDPKSIPFGQIFTDHMLEIEWDVNGWSVPKISPIHNLSLHPSAKVLHYANELFEGLKAYRCVDNKVRIFRPDMNMKRMQRSAARSAFPPFDEDELIKCLKKLIAIDSDWVLPADTQCSLYIRPTMIATEGALGVQTSKNGLLYIILAPVGSYFTSGNVIKPIELYASSKYVRAWPGGTGDSKLGSNYGPTLLIQNEAAKKGFQQILWLFGPDDHLTEAGTMNIFIAMKNKSDESIIDVMTPPIADGLILPGITRDSIIHLLKDWPNINLIERNVPMREVVEAEQSNRLVEIFGAGTACVVSPVGGINHDGKYIKVPTNENGIAAKVYKMMNDIFYGRVLNQWNSHVVE